MKKTIYEKQWLNMTPLFPNSVTESLAIDTTFIFKYSSQNVQTLSITFKSEKEELKKEIFINNRNGILTFKSPVKGKYLNITFKPLPVIIYWPEETTHSNTFSFNYKFGNSFTSDPLKITRIEPCNNCPFIPDHYKIFFNKPLSKETVLEIFGKEKIKLKDNLLILYTSQVTIPVNLKDIYGRSLTSEVVITFKLPCMFVREICIDPVHDWNDSKGGNRIPFDQIFGYGTINSYDQFILIENRCSVNRDFYLSLCNRDCINTGINPSSKYVRVSIDGKYFIIGDPPGNLKDYSEIIIKTYEGNTLDFVNYKDFSVKGGWWRDSENYHLSTTRCSIPF